MDTKEITTELGVISGRNAIVLKAFVTTLAPFGIDIEFNVNTQLCSGAPHSKKYLDGRIVFKNVIKYQMFSLDYFPFEKYIKSSLDEVQNSEYLIKYKLKDSHKHIYVSAYDHILEVVCKDYNIEFFQS